MASIARARRLMGKRLRLWELLRSSLDKASQTPALLPRLRRELGIFSRLVYRWLRREYTDVPVRLLVFVVAGLLYFLTPMDLIVDLLPGIGYLDDTAVIALLYQALRPELARFEAWEAERAAQG
jgi:uncharacterized membrane protein YkvA (DUF1232 family)